MSIDPDSEIDEVRDVIVTEEGRARRRRQRNAVCALSAAPAPDGETVTEDVRPRRRGDLGTSARSS